MERSGAAPFSAVPTAFPVRSGRRAWYGNCIWDALGIPAMLDQDARIDASCGCCNYEMVLEVKDGKLHAPQGLIHIPVPACHWYEDIVFT
jgi:alkylmercury lyase-like protein